MTFGRINKAVSAAIMHQAAAQEAWLERTCRDIFTERSLPQPQTLDEWRDALCSMGWVLGYMRDGEVRLMEGETVLASFRTHITTEVS